jgi:hypothetical protein
MINVTMWIIYLGIHTNSHSDDSETVGAGVDGPEKLAEYSGVGIQAIAFGKAWKRRI